MYKDRYSPLDLINISIIFGNSPNMLFTEAEALYNPKINRRNFSEIFSNIFLKTANLFMSLSTVLMKAPKNHD